MQFAENGKVVYTKTTVRIKRRKSEAERQDAPAVPAQPRLPPRDSLDLYENHRARNDSSEHVMEDREESPLPLSPIEMETRSVDRSVEVEIADEGEISGDSSSGNFPVGFLQTLSLMQVAMIFIGLVILIIVIAAIASSTGTTVVVKANADSFGIMFSPKVVHDARPEADNKPDLERVDFSSFDCERLASMFACYSFRNPVCLLIRGDSLPKAPFVLAAEEAVHGVNDWERGRIREICRDRRRLLFKSL